MPRHNVVPQMIQTIQFLKTSAHSHGAFSKRFSLSYSYMYHHVQLAMYSYYTCVCMT